MSALLWAVASATVFPITPTCVRMETMQSCRRGKSFVSQLLFVRRTKRTSLRQQRERQTWNCLRLRSLHCMHLWSGWDVESTQWVWQCQGVACLFWGSNGDKACVLTAFVGCKPHDVQVHLPWWSGSNGGRRVRGRDEGRPFFLQGRHRQVKGARYLAVWGMHHLHVYKRCSSDTQDASRTWANSPQKVFWLCWWSLVQGIHGSHGI